MRWETENNTPPSKDHGHRNKVLVVVLVIAVIAMISSAGYYLPQTSTTPPPPPGPTALCSSPTLCFSSQIDKNSFYGQTSLIWSITDNRTFNISNNSAKSPTVQPTVIYGDTVHGQLNLQFRILGPQMLNISLIRLYDMNMSSACTPSLNNCSSFGCIGSPTTACQMGPTENLYFGTPIPLRIGDVYQLIFSSSGNISTFQLRFHH